MIVPKLLAAFLLTSLCVGATIIAMGELHSASHAQTVRQVRKIIEQPTADLRPVLERTRVSVDTVLTHCKPLGVEAAVELDVFYADSFNPLFERDQWLTALNKLSTDARSALACQPTNGLIWARLAFAEWFLGRPVYGQVQMLDYSELYAPSELPALKARLIHWSRMTSRVIQDAKTSYDRDLWTLAVWMPPVILSAVWKNLSLIQMQHMSEISAMIPEDRLRELASRGIRFGPR